LRQNRFKNFQMTMNFSDTETPATLDQKHLPLSKVGAVGIGNALEFYDFLSFGLFSIQIGHTFFRPVKHPMDCSIPWQPSGWALRQDRSGG